MSGRLDLRLGIDVGGTNTDAVVLDRDGSLVAKAKRPTSVDVTRGITAALDAVLAEPAVEPGRIGHVMLGTTHATNAVLERTRLERVAAVRIGAPSTTSIPPLYDWPPDLRRRSRSARRSSPAGSSTTAARSFHLAGTSCGPSSGRWPDRPMRSR